MPKLRARIANGILRLGQVVQGAAALPLTAEAASEFMRDGYARVAANPPSSARADARVNRGLNPLEAGWLDEMGEPPNAKALVLGAGVGRESIALAQRGREVTAVDFIRASLDELTRQAAKRGSSVEVRCGDLVDVARYGGGYGLIWSTSASYSAIQGRERRIDFLRAVYDALAPGGHFLCRFVYKPGAQGRASRIKQLAAALLFANLEYEPGDRVYSGLEFYHQFGSRDAISEELERSPLELTSLAPAQSDAAVLTRPPA